MMIMKNTDKLILTEGDEIKFLPFNECDREEQERRLVYYNKEMDRFNEADLKNQELSDNYKLKVTLALFTFSFGFISLGKHKVGDLAGLLVIGWFALCVSAITHAASYKFCIDKLREEKSKLKISCLDFDHEKFKKETEGIDNNTQLVERIQSASFYVGFIVMSLFFLLVVIINK